MTTFQPGDRVRHNPTGEEWILIRAYGSYVVPAGWPASHAHAIDCTLIARDDTCTCTTLAEQNACTKSCDAVLL
jgi:hypothetical protein